MNNHHSQPRDRSDYQEHEAEYFAREARPAAAQDASDEDLRRWREDPNRKFGETFDAWRASRPARSGAAGSHRLPPSIGTDPGQPNSAAPGASGKNK